MSLKSAIRDEMDNWLYDDDYYIHSMTKVIPDILESIDKSMHMLWLRGFSDNLEVLLHNEKSLLYFIYKKERGLPVNKSIPFATIGEAEAELERKQLQIQIAIYMRQKLRELGVKVEETIDIDEEDILENVTENLAIIGHHDVEQGEEKGLEEEDMESTGEIEYPKHEDDEKDEDKEGKDEPKKNGEPAAPVTGDAADPILWLALLVLSCGAAGGVAVSQRRS